MNGRAKAAGRPLRHDLIRAAALEAYAAVRGDGRAAAAALEHVLRREAKRLYSSERRAVAEALWGLLKRERMLDMLMFGASHPGAGSGLGRFGDSASEEFSSLKRPRGMELYSLRLSALAVLEGLPPDEVAQRDALAPAQRELLRGAARALPRAEFELLSPVLQVALEGSLGDDVAALLVEEMGAEGALDFARAIGERAPLTLRANELKTTREALSKALAGEGLESTPTRCAPQGLTLSSRVNAFSLRAFQEGLFELQDEGSQLIALLVGARPGERIADACAGAGGKTLALAAQMRGKGELFAFDIDERRLGELQKRARRAGAHNIRIEPLDETAPPRALRGRDGSERLFDRLLIDAPCSGLGAIRRVPDTRYRLSARELERFAEQQRALLSRFASMVKPGGRLVYATCSVASLENEQVVARFLAAHGDYRMLPAEKLLPASCEGLVRGGALRTTPHEHGTDGFYCAALERRA